MRYFFLVLLLCFISFLPTANSQSPQEKLIVTSITPIKYLVNEVVGKDVRVEAVVGPNDDLHDMMLNYQKRMLISKASMVIVVDLEKEQFMQDALIDFKGKIIELKNIKKIKLLKQLPDYISDDVPTANDYHMWLSSENGFNIAESLVNDISTQFSLDKLPMNKRLVLFRAKLTDLEDKILKDTENSRNINFISAHDSLQYFANRFKLSYLGGVDLEHESLTTQERMLLKKKIETDNISSFLYEPNMSLDKINPLIKDTKVKACLVSNEYGISDKDGSYILLLSRISESLVACFNSGEK